MSKKIILFFFVFFLIPVTGNSALISLTKVAPVVVTPFDALLGMPLATKSFQALSSFRGGFNPASAAITIGGGLMIMAIGDGINSLRLQAGATATLPPPPGWASSDSPSATTAKIKTYKAINANLGGYFGDFSTGQQACDASALTWGSGPSYPTFTYSVPNICSGYTGFVQVIDTCPNGYVNSGSICTLTTPTAVQWPSDGIPTLSNTGSGFTPNPRDPDNGTTPSSSVQDRTGTDSYGNPVQETVQTNAESGIDYARKTQSQNSTTGQPSVQLDKFSTNSSGTIMSVTTANYENSTITNINTNSVSTTTKPIDISTLNKESTQIQIKDLLTPPEQSPDLAAVDQPVQDAENGIISGITGVNTSLLSNPAATLSLPVYWSYASGTCYPADMDMGRFGSVSLSKFCNIYDEHIKPLLIFVFGVLHVFSYWNLTIRESM